MLPDRAKTLPAAACRIPPEMLDRRSPVHGVERPLAAGARHGFAKMIANRGRHDDGSTERPSIVRTRPLAATPATDTPALQVGVAKSFAQIEAADSLIRRRYAWRGYSLELFEYQGRSGQGAESRNNITFFAADEQTTLGTITLRLDGPEGLRADATHSDALRHARRDNGSIAELTRLALAEDVDSRLVLSSLFGLVYAVGRWVHGVTDVFIEVNPRHVAFYSRVLGFVVAGETRFCERVLAPSVLLHADVETLEERLGFAATIKVEEPEPMMRYAT